MTVADLGDYHFYPYNPSLTWNIIFAVIMGICLVGHTGQMVLYRSWWFGSMFAIGTLCELIGYVARCLSHRDVTDKSTYIAQAICLVFAPVFLMAGTYYLLSLLICIYGRRYSWISAKLCSWLFAVCDLISLLLQGGGGGLMATGDDGGYQLGRRLTTAGLVFQLVTMIVFMVMIVSFLWKIHYMRDKTGLAFVSKYSDLRQKTQFKYYPLIIIAASLLIFIRSAFRLAEFTQARDGDLQDKEYYFLVLDALMVTMAIILLNVFHPGRVVGNVRIKQNRGEEEASEFAEDVDMEMVSYGNPKDPFES